MTESTTLKYIEQEGGNKSKQSSNPIRVNRLSSFMNYRVELERKIWPRGVVKGSAYRK